MPWPLVVPGPPESGTIVGTSPTVLPVAADGRVVPIPCFRITDVTAVVDSGFGAGRINSTLETESRKQHSEAMERFGM